jgi:hypothetical protein
MNAVTMEFLGIFGIVTMLFFKRGGFKQVSYFPITQTISVP